MSNTNSKKTQYFGIGFVAAVVVAMILMFTLNYASASSETTSIKAYGFTFLGIFGDAGDVIKSTVWLWIAVILMIAFFALCIILLVGCVQKLIKKENIISSRYFNKWILTILLCSLALFVLSVIISHQLAEAVGNADAVTLSWLPLLFIIAADVLAHEFLSKCDQEPVESADVESSVPAAEETPSVEVNTAETEIKSDSKK